MSSDFEHFLDELAAERRLPAAGTGTAVAVAIAAALVEMVARSAGDRETGRRARELRQRALSLGEADAKAYAEVAASGAEPSGPATDVPLQIAETAAEVQSLASAAVARVGETLGADASAAGMLAEAGARSAAGLVLVNLGERSDDPRAARARELLSGGEDRPSEQPWALGRRLAAGEAEIAWDVFGEGPPVVLVHGTPSWSYLWRKVAPVLSQSFTVYAFDLHGYGDSPAPKDADLSIAAHARVLVELLDRWGLDRPAVAGHDIGGAIALRAHLLHERRFSRIALVDAVVLAPWITPTTRHVQAHLDVYRTMPAHIFERITAAHLRTAVHRGFSEQAFAAYHGRWAGEAGQAAYLQKVACFDEDDTRELEPLLPDLDVPVQIVWGEHDAWLQPAGARRLAELIPGARVRLIEGAGHFSTEDAPDEVARTLADFFGGEKRRLEG